MYAVVGCGECNAMWIVADEPERSQCPQCKRSRAFDARRKFVTTDDADHAREVRARLLAAQADEEAAFAAVDSFAELETAVADAGVDDEEYLAGMGLDPAAIDDEDAATGGGGRPAVVREAIRTLEEPTVAAVTEFASDRGVPRDAAERVLQELHRAGEVKRSGDVYRLL